MHIGEKKDTPKFEPVDKAKAYTDDIKKRFKFQHPFSSTKINKMKNLQMLETKMNFSQQSKT